MLIRNILYKQFLLLLLMFIGVSCKQVTKVTKEVFVNSYLLDSLTNSCFLHLNVIKDKNCSVYTYQTTDFTLDTVFMLKVCDSVAYFNNIECPVLQIIHCSVDEKDYEVVVFLFDVKHSNDEELLLFFHAEYGLLVNYSRSWGLSQTFVSDIITQNLALEIIRNQRIILPKPSNFNHLP